MKRATCVRGVLLIVLLVLTSFASDAPSASASDCSHPSYPATCCRCINRCEARYQACLSQATTPAQELTCYNNVIACDNSCYNGIACGMQP